ncbi:Cobalt-precorrin-6x reductase [Pseudomonas caricapapayae]|nr:Cobalt-precorrin-6x reductase [Pseudomonas caricapapayae]
MFEQRRIDVLISKNSGGHSTEPKLEVARDLGLPVLILKRPPLADVDRVFWTVDEVLEALGLEERR